jgi:hypothetical protein
MGKRSRSKTSAKIAAVIPPAQDLASLHWRGITRRADHTPNYINDGWSHIELRVLAPQGAPLRITSTGYLSHFLSEDHIVACGAAACVDPLPKQRLQRRFLIRSLRRTPSPHAYELAYLERHHAIAVGWFDGSPRPTSKAMT